MKLKDIYQEVIKRGIESDVRGRKEIEAMLEERKKEYGRLEKKEKECFDQETLWNPFPTLVFFTAARKRVSVR
jgi:hypothetical protein